MRFILLPLELIGLLTECHFGTAELRGRRMCVSVIRRRVFKRWCGRVV